MPSYSPPLSTILARISKLAIVDYQDQDDTGEWIQLIPVDLTDDELYSLLKSNWSRIIGYIHQFALLYCRTGEDSGVWLHYLPTTALRGQYLRGCFELPEW